MATIREANLLEPHRSSGLASWLHGRGSFSLSLVRVSSHSVNVPAPPPGGSSPQGGCQGGSGVQVRGDAFLKAAPTSAVNGHRPLLPAPGHCGEAIGAFVAPRDLDGGDGEVGRGGQGGWINDSNVINAMEARSWAPRPFLSLARNTEVGHGTYSESPRALSKSKEHKGATPWLKY